MLIQPLHVSKARRGVISTISSMHEAPCTSPSFEISCESMLTAQSSLLLLTLSPQVEPPEKCSDEDGEQGEEEEVVVEDIGIVHWLLRRVICGGIYIGWHGLRWRALSRRVRASSYTQSCRLNCGRSHRLLMAIVSKKRIASRVQESKQEHSNGRQSGRVFTPSSRKAESRSET